MVRSFAPLFILLLCAQQTGCGESQQPDGTPPGTITDLAVTSVGDSSVTLTWTAPGDDSDRGRASAYDLRYGKFSVLTYWNIAFHAPASPPGLAGSIDSAVVSDLEEDAAYNFAIQAMDDAGNRSELSNMASGVPEDLVAPRAIMDLEATAVTHHVIELHWTAPGDDEGVGLVEGYDIRYDTAPLVPTMWQTYPQVAFTQMPAVGDEKEVYQLRELEPSTTYHVAVKAFDDAGNMAEISNGAMTATPADTIPPGVVTDLAVRLETPVTVVLEWTAPGDDGDEGQATSYDMRYSGDPITEATWETAASIPVPSPRSVAS